MKIIKKYDDFNIFLCYHWGRTYIHSGDCGHESVSEIKNNTASWRDSLTQRIIILGQYILSQTNENRFTIEKKKLA